MVVFLVLIFILIILTLTYIGLQGDKYIDVFLPNLIAGFFGTLVTVFIVDKLLKAEKERVEKRYNSMAEKQLAKHLQRIRLLFAEMIKGVVFKSDLDRVENYDDLFSEEFVGQLKYFNFKTTPPELSSASWSEYVYKVLNAAEKRCTEIINSYFLFIDPDLAEDIDSFFSSAFYSYTKNANIIIPVTDKYTSKIKGFAPYQIPVAHLMPSFNSLSKIMSRLKELNPDISFPFDLNLLSANVSPAPGSCRDAK